MGEVGIGIGASPPAKREEEGEVGSRRRRSTRLIKMKEANEPVERQILKLKREMKALMARRRVLDGRMVGKEAQPPREEPQPLARAVKKRKKVVKRMVPKELIDYIIQNPHNPWNGYPEEELRNRSQKFREFYAKEKALADKVLEYEKALIKQFRTKGYAEDYTEVTDNDEDN